MVSGCRSDGIEKQLDMGLVGGPGRCKSGWVSGVGGERRERGGRGVGGIRERG